MSQKYSFYNDPSIKLIDPADWDDKNSIKEEIKQLFIENTGISPEKLDITQNLSSEERGDYSCSVAMALANEKHSNPVEIANDIVNKLGRNDLVQKFEVIKPGFINIYINKEKFVKRFTNFDKQEMFKPLKGKRIMVEFAHPNPFKAFHIGHLRNIILGESIVRLLENSGAEVIRTNYQGDVGMHIAKCLWSFKKIPQSDYPSEITKRVELIAKCYTEGAKAFEDPVYQEEIMEINKKIYSKQDENINKLWTLGKQWSLDKFHEIYKLVDSHFDREYMESETLPFVDGEIKKAVNKSILTKSQGALIFDGSKYGIETHVYQNSQGLPTYEGKQLGLVEPMEMKDFGNLDLLLFNVAVEQIGYFKSTIKVIELMYPELEGKQYHNAYEFVGLKTGKMSSRTGNVVLGEDIINEAIKKILDIVKDREGMMIEDRTEVSEIVGVGAIKYSFLNISPTRYLAFDLEKSLAFDGNSGPYIQYTYTRANKIFNDSKLNLDDLNITNNFIANNASDAELALIKKILDFESIVIDSTKLLSPNILTNYLFELSQNFNSFYKTSGILKAETEDLKNFRVLLTSKVRYNLLEGLRLLGIKVPESM